MLRKTQDDFTVALLSPAPPAPELLAQIADNGISAADRLSVYRDNIAAGLTEALFDAYPAVRLLVDNEFMQMMAARYIALHPPRCADVNQYGADFPTFIASFPAATELPYLADVARMEWLLHEAAFAPDTDALEPQSLAALPENAQTAATLRLRPCVRFIDSPWPLAAIRDFALAQHENSTLNIDSGGGIWLIARPALDVIIDQIIPAQRDFYRAFTDGMTLGTAVTSVTAQHPAFDLAAALTHGFRYAVFTAPPANQ